MRVKKLVRGLLKQSLIPGYVLLYVGMCMHDNCDMHCCPPAQALFIQLCFNWCNDNYNSWKCEWATCLTWMIIICYYCQESVLGADVLEEGLISWGLQRARTSSSMPLMGQQLLSKDFAKATLLEEESAELSLSEDWSLEPLTLTPGGYLIERSKDILWTNQ